MNLDALATRIASKDEKAFEEAYNALSKAVFSVCYSIVKSEAIARELSQDTFVAVWKYASSFRGVGFKSWTLTIARNKSLNYIEKQKREISVDFSESEEYTRVAEEDSVDNETRITLKCAIESLDEVDRQIVLLKTSGVKLREIAEYLKMPRGTVSWRYGEALKRLKKYMEGRSL